jgi:hypothetical protein
MNYDPYDERTAHQLVWLHGEPRAIEILSGRDAATEHDIRAWRKLGGNDTRAMLEQRLRLGRQLYADGWSMTDAAQIAEVGVVALRSSWENHRWRPSR